MSVLTSVVLSRLPRLTSGLRVFSGLRLNAAAVLPAYGPQTTLLKETCRIDSCRASLLLPSMGATAFHRETGIRIGTDWYCSSPCFESTVEARIFKLLLAQPVRPSNPDRMPLNLLLMARGWLTHPQSLQAAEEQKNYGGQLDEVLVHMGFVTEQQITLARATQAGYPVYSLQNRGNLWIESGPAVLRSTLEASAGSRTGKNERRLRADGMKMASEISIPRALLERYSMLPLHYAPATRRLLIGFVHTVEHGLLYAIEQMTGCKAEPCFLTREDFRDQLHRSATRPANDEVRVDQPARAPELARTICSYAVEIKADEARFSRTRDYLWARLRSGRQEVDLLFRQPLSYRPRDRRSPRESARF